MLTGPKQPLHLSSPQGAHPSLLPLQQALIAAESGVPARPPCIDLNEQLARQLIARMQVGYKNAPPFIGGLQDIPGPRGVPVNLHEMTDTHAR